MPSIRIDQNLRSEIYFLTFTVKHWYDLFDRNNRFQILSDSIQYCQKHKGLKVLSYVFMLNHLHLIATSPDMIGFVRDFKCHVSREIKKNIIATEPTILKLFSIGDEQYEFWEKTNMPKLIETPHFLEQKMNYIHENPVRKQYVNIPEHWVWSSANPKSAVSVDSFDL
jgi:putative transposase